MIDYDVAGAQFVLIVGCAADGDFVCVVEAVAHGGKARDYAADFAGNQFLAEDRDDA